MAVYNEGMLLPLRKLDPQTRLKCQRNGWVAFEPQTGAYLRQSQPARARGSPAQYILMIPNVMARVIWAASERDALAQANNGRG
jgi:hypothetical protein